MLAQAAAPWSPTATLTIFGGAFLALLLLAPGRVGERLHAWAFGLVVWVLQRPFALISGLGKAIVALVGQEIARWLAIGMSGVMIFALAWLVVHYLPEATPGYEVILLCVALLGMIWFFAVVRAFKLSAQNRLWRVQQRQFFRKMAAEAEGTRKSIDRLQGFRDDVVSGAARRTRGTPLSGVFRVNRDRDADEAAQRQIAAQRAEEDAQEAAAAAEANRHAQERRDRWAEQVGKEHDPFAKQGS